MIRLLATLLGLGALAVAIAGLVARYLPISGHPTLILAAGAPYLMTAAPAAVLLFGLGRRWVLTLVAFALTLALLWTYVPRYLPTAPPQVDAVDVRVLTANLFFGQADPAAFVTLARETADIVAVQELTPQSAAGLSAAGMDNAFPYRVLLPGDSAFGIGLWSRYQIVHSGRIEGYAFPIVGARVRIPGVRVDATVLSLHLVGPWPTPIDGWRSDIAGLPATLRDVGSSAGAGAVLVAGDFNATADMAPFRRLLDEGYADAGADAGAGLVRTYPGRGQWPPLIGIDHILTKNSSAVTAQTVVVPGADHRGLLSTVRVPVDITAS